MATAASVETQQPIPLVSHRPSQNIDGSLKNPPIVSVLWEIGREEGPNWWLLVVES